MLVHIQEAWAQGVRMLAGDPLWPIAVRLVSILSNHVSTTCRTSEPVFSPLSTPAHQVLAVVVAWKPFVPDPRL